MKKYNLNEVGVMSSTDLRKVASDLGIPNYSKYKKDELLVEVRKVLEVKPDKKEPTKHQLIEKECEYITEKGGATLTPAEWTTLIQTSVNNSSRIRDLFDGGFRKSVIAKVIGIRPQMVHNVINNYLEKQKEESKS